MKQHYLTQNKNKELKELLRAHFIVEPRRQHGNTTSGSYSALAEMAKRYSFINIKVANADVH